MSNNTDKQKDLVAPEPGDAEGSTPVSDVSLREQEPPLGHALFRVMRALVFDDRPVPELDALPLGQLRLLMSVYYGPNSTMKDFSERLNVSQSTVTQLAERLVKRGLVVRVMDATDRRVIRLHTSVHGQDLIGQADSTRRATLRKVWFALVPEEQQLLEKALGLLETGEKKFASTRDAPCFPFRTRSHAQPIRVRPRKPRRPNRSTS
jgi:DNA-binding MarR family transcriptional regulator